MNSSNVYTESTTTTISTTTATNITTTICDTCFENISKETKLINNKDFKTYPEIVNNILNNIKHYKDLYSLYSIYHCINNLPYEEKTQYVTSMNKVTKILKGFGIKENLTNNLNNIDLSKPITSKQKYRLVVALGELYNDFDPGKYMDLNEIPLKVKYGNSNKHILVNTHSSISKTNRTISSNDIFEKIMSNQTHYYIPNAKIKYSKNEIIYVFTNDLLETFLSFMSENKATSSISYILYDAIEEYFNDVYSIIEIKDYTDIADAVKKLLEKCDYNKNGRTGFYSEPPIDKLVEEMMYIIDSYFI